MSLRGGATVYDCRMFEVDLSIETLMLADYFRWLFPAEATDGRCRITITHPTGALMTALAQPAALRVKPDGANILHCQLPQLHRRGNFDQENHWLFYDQSSTRKINLALRAEFDLEFAGYYRRGEQLGMRKMDIIDAFIFSRGLAAENFDALSKRTYRAQVRDQERIRKKLLRRSYYINESIDYTGLFDK